MGLSGLFGKVCMHVCQNGKRQLMTIVPIGPLTFVESVEYIVEQDDDDLGDEA